MPKIDGSLTRFYRGWAEHNALVIAMIAPLSAEQLAIRPGLLPDPLWSTAAHIAGCRANWFHGLLGAGDPAVKRYHDWEEPGAPARSAAELVTALTETWALIDNCLRRWTPAMLDDAFQREGRPTRTRQWVIWHVFEHDIHHAGEISVTLGANGLAGLDL